ncbi:MAG: diaminopimelate epimerase, partial [Gammaproteobacteria bacterium]|nr:diaminopimelate epimerase [Gammaproteobacteria bacterium]
MEISFTKMHGLGNDFVVIDAVSQSINLSREQIVALADRHFGIGCDQLLLVEKPTTSQAEFRYRIFNADGGEVEQCGNGARCFAIFVRQQGLTTNTRISVETAGGLIELRVITNDSSDDLVTVDMGVPNFQPQSLPFLTENQAESYNLMVNGTEYAIAAVSMGNPHAVMLVDDLDKLDIETLGPAIEGHELFPNRVNAGFMQIVNRDEIRLRVFERGAGETQACGTGACAAVAVGRASGQLDERVTVHLRGGDLSIQWQGEGQDLLM